MEIVISVSEAELEEFPEEAPESSGQQEQSSETSHTQGTVKKVFYPLIPHLPQSCSKRYKEAE